MGKSPSARDHTQGEVGDPTEIGVEVQISPALSETPSEDYLHTVAVAALRHEGAAGHVTLVITDDQGIQALNRDFLGTDMPTDVLAFGTQGDADRDSFAGTFVAAPEAQRYLGDVIVSYPRAVVQAKEAGHTTEQELALLTVHGILHLLGYDHADGDMQAVMWRLQEDILRSVRREKPASP